MNAVLEVQAGLEGGLSTAFILGFLFIEVKTLLQPGQDVGGDVKGLAAAHTFELKLLRL